MNNELEGAVQATAAASDGGVLKAVLVYVISPLIAVIATIFGLTLKRKGAEQATEDTVYGEASQTISRLTAEVKERDATITQLQGDIAILSKQRNEADMHASRASVQAEIAADSAKRASAAAEEARHEVERMRAARKRDHAYIQTLRASMKDAGVPLPLLPEGWEDL